MGAKLKPDLIGKPNNAKFPMTKARRSSMLARTLNIF
jgi:hypothetical protein